MDIIYHLNEPTGEPVVVFNGSISEVSEVDAHYLWACGVCCGETGGPPVRNEAPTRVVFRFEVGAVLCAELEVEVVNRRVECRYPTCTRSESGSLYFQVRGTRYDRNPRQGCYVFQGMVAVPEA